MAIFLLLRAPFVLSVILLLLGSIRAATALDRARNRFLNPPDTDENPVWLFGEEQVISWRTELETYNITIWQENPKHDGGISGGVVFSSTSDIDNPTNFTWIVQTYNFDLDYSNMFFFWVNYGNSDFFISHYFNITRDESVTLTRSASTTSTASAASSAITSTPTYTATSSPESQMEDELTDGAKVGLGVGLGIGVPVIILLGFIAFSNYFKRSKPEEAHPPIPPSVIHVRESGLAELPKQTGDDNDHPFELEGGYNLQRHRELGS